MSVDLRRMRQKCGDFFSQIFVLGFKEKWPQTFSPIKSSTFSTVHQINFFHCCNSGTWGGAKLLILSKSCL